jgi:hypothetical protein
MSKLHYCINGKGVTEQVCLYQKTRKSEDFLPVQWYYNEYKEQWFKQVSDYIDRQSFDVEFDFKLVKAIETFKIATADAIATTKGYNILGAFNGWFYKILLNWKSNIKNSSFRLRKRPAIQCPVCHRHVVRIDQEHLKHNKTLKDLPKYFVWKKHIYETMNYPKVYVYTWGKKTNEVWNGLMRGDQTIIKTRKKIRWPWRFGNDKRAVLCPFTKRMLEEISVEHIQSLPDKYRCYARPMKWTEFASEYPDSLIQSEIFSLDHNSDDDGFSLKNTIYSNPRVNVLESNVDIDYDNIRTNDVPYTYENAFRIIDEIISDDTDRDILKLLSVGYATNDILDTLNISKKEFTKCMRSVSSNQILKQVLQE